MYNFRDVRSSDRKMAVLIFVKTVDAKRDTRETRGETRDPLVKNSITAHSRLPGMSRQFVCRTGKENTSYFHARPLAERSARFIFTFL